MQLLKPEVVFWNLDQEVDIKYLTFLPYVLADSKTFGAIFNFVTQPEVIQNFWNFFVSCYFKIIFAVHDSSSQVMITSKKNFLI